MPFKRINLNAPTPEHVRRAKWANVLPRTAATMFPPPNIIAVWHAVNPTFTDPTEVDLAAFPQGYKHVADVATNHVGRVFELTNNIDHDWQENPEIVWAVERARSTSVGDIYTTNGGKIAVYGVGLKSFR